MKDTVQYPIAAVAVAAYIPGQRLSHSSIQVFRNLNVHCWKHKTMHNSIAMEQDHAHNFRGLKFVIFFAPTKNT